MNRKILITGGAGFIGSHACKHFIARGYSVVNLDKLTYAGSLSSLAPLEHHPRYRFVRGDIADTRLVEALLRENAISAVLNLAAESHVDRSISAPSDFIQTNIVGTFNLLRAVMDYFDDLTASAQENFRFIHVSTDEVYGSLGESGSFHRGNAGKTALALRRVQGIV